MCIVFGLQLWLDTADSELYANGTSPNRGNGLLLQPCSTNTTTGMTLLGASGVNVLPGVPPPPPPPQLPGVSSVFAHPHTHDHLPTHTTTSLQASLCHSTHWTPTQPSPPGTASRMLPLCSCFKTQLVQPQQAPRHRSLWRHHCGHHALPVDLAGCLHTMAWTWSVSRT